MITDPTKAREAAVKRLTARRDFGMHAVVYVAFNAALVLVWYLTGHGYFWPAWLIGLWGSGLAAHAWDAFGRRPITEEDVLREMERQGGGHPQT
jgi:2TM domain